MLFYTIGFLTVLLLSFAIYRMFAFRKESKEMMEARFGRIRPLMDKFDANQTLTAAEVVPYAENNLTRELTYRLLEANDQLDLFPEKYKTIIHSAESNLVNWLEFPTELGTVPDEIKHVERVTFHHKNDDVHYEVFKYRTSPPHFAAKDGWLLGVVGPYFDDSKAYDETIATFSRMTSKVGKVSPREEAEWVHENVAMK